MLVIGGTKRGVNFRVANYEALAIVENPESRRAVACNSPAGVLMADHRVSNRPAAGASA